MRPPSPGQPCPPTPTPTDPTVPAVPARDTGEPDRQRWEAAYEDDEEVFCHLFGPEYILSEVSEFLGYFMVRKVMAGQDLLRSAGTVDRGTTASRDLPRAERLANLLYEQGLVTAATGTRR